MLCPLMGIRTGVALAQVHIRNDSFRVKRLYHEAITEGEKNSVSVKHENLVLPHSNYKMFRNAMQNPASLLYEAFELRICRIQRQL